MVWLCPIHIFRYNVPANPTGVDEATVQVVLPHDTRFFQLWGHIHIAGYNISLFHGKTVCAARTLPIPARLSPRCLQPLYCHARPSRIVVVVVVVVVMVGGWWWWSRR